MNKITLEPTNQTFAKQFSKSVCTKLKKHNFDVNSLMYVSSKSNRRNTFRNMNDLISKSRESGVLLENTDFVEIILYSYNGIKFLIVWDYQDCPELPDRTIMSDGPIIEFE